MTREEMKQTAKECRIANKSTVLWDSGVRSFATVKGKTVRTSSGVTYVRSHEESVVGGVVSASRKACRFTPVGGPRSKRCTCADGE